VPAAALNHRTYLVALAYSMSFGVELTVDNVITYFYYDHFGLSPTAAGLVSSVSKAGRVGWGARGGAWTMRGVTA
jgi:NNP family nitrate/nitrite transporter-like MFS transporter